MGFAEQRLALSLRSSLIGYMHSKLAGECEQDGLRKCSIAPPRMSRLLDKIDDPDSRICADTDLWAKTFATLFSSVVRPTLEGKSRLSIICYLRRSHVVTHLSVLVYLPLAKSYNFIVQTTGFNGDNATSHMLFLLYFGG